MSFLTRTEWFSKIKSACDEAGTYQEFFDPVIETLATILEKRDEAYRVFDASGGHVIITHTNKAGAKNNEQNPALRLANDLNRDALAYWRDLGLTPAGLRKLNADVVKGKGDGSLEKLLSKIV